MERGIFRPPVLIALLERRVFENRLFYYTNPDRGRAGVDADSRADLTNREWINLIKRGR